MNMELGGKKNHKFCNRASAVVESVKAVHRRDDVDAEKESLLSSGENGGAASGKRKKGLNRKVQWNDRKGNNLVEVLEFHTSDASDSEEEYLDSCFCIIINIFQKLPRKLPTPLAKYELLKNAEKERTWQQECHNYRICLVSSNCVSGQCPCGV